MVKPDTAGPAHPQPVVSSRPTDVAMRPRESSQSLSQTSSRQGEAQPPLSESSGSSNPPAPDSHQEGAPRLDLQAGAGSSHEARESGADDEAESCSSSESDEAFAEVLNRVKEVLRLDAQPQAPLSPRASPLTSLDLQGIAHYISSGAPRWVVGGKGWVMPCGPRRVCGFRQLSCRAAVAQETPRSRTPMHPARTLPP